jgi:hypothetical protein
MGFFHVTDRPDFPNMSDNQVLTVLKQRKFFNSEHIFLLYVKLEDFMMNALKSFQAISHIKIVLKTDVYEGMLCFHHQNQCGE